MLLNKLILTHKNKKSIPHRSLKEEIAQKSLKQHVLARRLVKSATFASV